VPKQVIFSSHTKVIYFPQTNKTHFPTACFTATPLTKYKAAKGDKRILMEIKGN
jgi:hypothetical protein